MNDIVLERDKLFCSTSKNQSTRNSEIVIAHVTICLSSHDKCTGRYIDFTDSYSIVCDCACHKKIQAIHGPVSGGSSNW